MKTGVRPLFFAALAGVVLSAAAQSPLRVRGEVVSFDGAVLTVRTPDAGNARVELAKNGTVAWRKPLALADLRPGMPLGVTAVNGGEGKLVAREIQVFPGAAAPNPGHRPMEGGATMTNATLSATVSASKGRELTVTYPGGAQQVVVPDDALIYTPVDGDRSLLAPGVPVTLLATPASDGRLTATRVQVTKR